MDQSKQPETGHTGAAFFISLYEIAVKKRAADRSFIGVHSRDFSNCIGITVVGRKQTEPKCNYGF